MSLEEYVKKFDEKVVFQVFSQVLQPWNHDPKEAIGTDL